MACIQISTGVRGRGIFATSHIPASTSIEISPVILFSKEEYNLHGKFTLLDHYTFNWPDGQMALALGLGSLFNHSNDPNVSFALDTTNNSIRYTTVKAVSPGDELCIFYGHKLWFELAEVSATTDAEDTLSEHDVVHLPTLGIDDLIDLDATYPFESGDVLQVLPQDDLPFQLHQAPPDEETIETVHTCSAWVADIAEPQKIRDILRWVQTSQLDPNDLDHLKRIRKKDDKTTILLTTGPDPPHNLPDALGEPYILPIPISTALTHSSMLAKLHFWPTIYTPPRKDAPKEWTRGQIREAFKAMKTTVDAAVRNGAVGELPIAAYVPVMDVNLSTNCSFTAKDTRTSAKHPLRHAIIDLIRQIADWRAESPIRPPSSTPSSEEGLENGLSYLLTDQTIFTTHEPCVMCSMALLHSRVKEVHYLFPSPETGGCGGSTCLPSLPSVNHRFRIYRWDPKYLPSSMQIQLDPVVDA